MAYGLFPELAAFGDHSLSIDTRGYPGGVCHPFRQRNQGSTLMQEPTTDMLYHKADQVLRCKNQIVSFGTSNALPLR